MYSPETHPVPTIPTPSFSIASLHWVFPRFAALCRRLFYQGEVRNVLTKSDDSSHPVPNLAAQWMEREVFRRLGSVRAEPDAAGLQPGGTEVHGRKGTPEESGASLDASRPGKSHGASALDAVPAAHTGKQVPKRIQNHLNRFCNGRCIL